MAKPKVGYNVRLVSFEERHARAVMNWYYDVRYEAFFREFPDEAMDLGEFKKFGIKMARVGLGLYVVEENSTGEAIGLMTHSCLKKKAGVFRFGIMLAAGKQHKSYAIECIILLGFYLIEHHGMQKYLVEFLESDTHIQRITEQGGFIRDGVLAREAFVGGEYVNEVRYYLTREMGYELYGAYHKSLDDLPANKKN